MKQLDLRRNLTVLTWVSAFYGLAFGIYDLALPLHLHSRGFTGMTGSLVYAVPILVCIVVRLWVGPLSDRLGRKLFYGLALLGNALSSLLTPFLPWVAGQVALRSLRDASVAVRDTVHSIVLYETAKRRFIGVLGRIGGVQILSQCLGFLIVGYGLTWLVPRAAGGETGKEGYGPVLVLSGVMLLGVTALFARGFKEQVSAGGGSGDSSFLGDLLRLRLDNRLYVMMLSILIFNLGFAACHTYIMFVFWPDKFAVTRAGMGWIMFAHRLLLALPMLAVGRIVRGPLHRHRRLLMIVSLLLQSATIVAAGVIPLFWLALGIWLLHDLLGAGVWFPIRSELLQRYCRGHVRGADTSKALALAQVGSLAGVLLAGWCYMPRTGNLVRGLFGMAAQARQVYGLAFVVGGIIMALSVLPLLLLLVIDPEERGEAAAGADA
ncbi:MAG: hypothetical protein QGH74_06810 [Candidatus Brocadiia bacterium]|jgi:hypothetical protein|nr:hypothetical protein [Candidatus Brocadiia bacterium]